MANEVYHKLSRQETSAQNRVAILGVLHEHGVSNPIISGDITKQTGISGVGIRAVVSECRKEGLPIASGDTGYFWAVCAHELEGTIMHIVGRRTALDEVVCGLRSAQSTVLRVDEIDLTEIFSGDGGE